MQKIKLISYLAISLILFQAGCMTKAKEMVRDVKYSAYESIGIEKRDLFKRNVADVKEAQGDTKEDFQDALEQLKNVYKFDGGKLERSYNKLRNANEDAKNSAQQVSLKIAQLETVAGDLFREWNKEIDSMGSTELKNKSRQKLKDTQSKFSTLRSQLKSTESKMTPLLAKLNDQVLFIKHNLNAAALTGLKTEASKIEGDIERLIGQINESSKEADAVIESL